MKTPHWLGKLGPASFHGSPGCAGPRGWESRWEGRRSETISPLCGKQADWPNGGARTLSKTAAMMAEREQQGGETETRRQNRIVLTRAISPKKMQKEANLSFVEFLQII